MIKLWICFTALIGIAISQTVNPNYVHFTLTESNTTMVVWLADMKLNDAYVVCSENGTASPLELFVTKSVTPDDLVPFILYDSNDFKKKVPTDPTAFVSDLLSESHIRSSKPGVPRSITSESGCFTIWAQTDKPTYATVLFRILPIQNENVETDNIYEASNELPTINAKAVNESREIIILSSQSGLTVEILPSTTIGQTYVFTNTINPKNVFLNLDYQENNVWNNFGLYTPALSIIIPENSEINIKADVFEGPYLIEKTGCEFYKKGIIASPSYSGITNAMYDMFIYNTTFDRSNVINFNVKVFGISTATLYYGDNNNKTFTKNETFTFTSDYFYIENGQNNSVNNGLLIEYTFASVLNSKNKIFNFTDTDPYYTMLTDDIEPNDALIFCSDKLSDTEVFITGETMKNYFYVYDSPFGSTFKYDTCRHYSPSSDTIPPSILSNKGCLIFYNWKNDSNTATIFARSRSGQAGNCETNSNVFQFPNSSNTVATTAKSAGSCEMVILASAYLNITSVSISIEKLEQVKNGSLNFKSVITKKDLFSIDSSDIQHWMNFGIFTHGLVISVPPNNALSLTGKVQTDAYFIVKNGCQHIQKGIMISPSLSGIDSSLFENEFLYNSTFAQNNTLDFTVEILYGNENVELFYDNSSTILSAGQKLSVVAKQFFLSVKNTMTSSSDMFKIIYTLTSNVNPNYNYFNLTDSNSYFLTMSNDIPVNGGIVVCGTPNDVDIHVTDGASNSLCLYDSKNLENNVPFSSSFSSLPSSSGCFFLYRASGNTPAITALIRSKSGQSKNCGDSNNIFQSSDASSDLTASSVGNGSCEIIILASEFTQLTTISINKIDKMESDFLIIKSSINDKQIVEIPAEDAKYWMNFGIHSYAITAVIPESNTVTLSTNVQRNGYNIQKNGCQHIQKGVIVSPGYTGIKQPDFAEVLYKGEFVQSNLMEFNVIESSDKESVTVYYDQLFDYELKQNETASVSAQNFTIEVFKKSNILTSDVLIEYSLTSNVNPTYNYINLTDNNPYYLELLDDIPVNNGIVVCSADTTDLFITDGKYNSFCLYDSEDLENNIPFGNGIQSSSKCFNLYRWHKNDTTATIFIRSRNDQAKNCKDFNNVFNVGAQAQATSEDNGTCEMMILGANYKVMSTILITDISADGNGNITINSPLNTKNIYDIQAQDTKYWKNFGFYTYALSIDVPINATVTVNTKAQNGPNTIQKKGCDLISKGLIASPAFTGSNYDITDAIYESQVDREHTVEINVLKMSEGDTVLLEYYNDLGNQTVVTLKSGHFPKFTTNVQTSFNIRMNKTTPSSDGFLIQYTLTSNIYPNYKTIYLTENMPYYLSLLENINYNDAIIFCSIDYNKPNFDSTDFELIITSGSHQDFWIHNSKNLESCTSFPTAFGGLGNMQPIGSCFNIYRFAKTETPNTATIMVRQQKLHTKNCNFYDSFKINVFQISNSLSVPTVEANENGSCEMIVFASGYDTTTSISIDSIYRLHTHNVLLQSSTFKNTLLNVSSFDTFKWQGFGIFTNALTVIVPPKNLVVLKSHVGHGAYNITKYMDGQKGIMTTPAYTGGLTSTDIKHFYNIKNTYNITVNINVKEFLGNPFVVFQSQNDDKWINTTLSAQSKSLTQNASSFGLYASEKRGEGILLEYSFNDFFHPNPINFTIDAANPTYPLWLDAMNVNDALTVCSNSGPLTIQVTSTNNQDALSKYRLFDSTALLNFATDLSKISTSSFSQGYMPGNYTSKSGCFTLYREPGNATYATALFSIPSIQKRNCISDGNVLQTQNPSSNDIFLFQVGASHTGPCEMIILSSQSLLPLISIENVSVSPDSNFVFKNLVNQKQLFNLSSNDATAFKKVGIYSYALSVIIPAGKILNMLAYNSQGPYTITSDISTEKGIMASPSFNGISGASVNPLYNIVSNDALSVSINVKILDGNLVMQNGNENTTLKNNDTKTYQGKNFNFYFDNTNNANNGFLLEYTINKTITPTSDNNGSEKIILNISLYFLIAFISFVLKTLT